MTSLIVFTRAQGFDEAELRAAGYFGVSEAAEEPSFEEAFGALEGGVGLFDALPYDEPHGWLMSVMGTDCDGLRRIATDCHVMIPKVRQTLAALRSASGCTICPSCVHLV